MRFDTKIGIVVRDDLASWQRLNVTAFLASAIASIGELIGEPYRDGSGNEYLPMLRQPVLIFTGDAAALTLTHERALARGIGLAVYTEDLFATGNDADNRAAVAAVPADKLNLVGLAVHGPRNAVDKVLKGLTLHP
jgi:hypothetical protein